MVDPRAHTVGMLMRRHFVSVGPQESLLEADRIMRLARIRHLPVIQRGRLVGVLSHRDVLEATLSHLDEVDGAKRIDHLRTVPIAHVMRRDAETALESTTLGEAARRMLSRKIGCLVVVGRDGPGDEVTGIITESDLLRAAYAPEFADASD
jgi:CBS domain-containing membrane protein